MNDDELVIRPLSDADARDIAGWRYDGDWSIYDSRPDTPLSADDGYWAVLDARTLIGFCCVGPEARVRGLTERDDVTDIGVGMRPELTGHGGGKRFAAAVMAFARSRGGPTRLRAVVQSWNTRSLRLCRSLGFVEDARHTCVQDGREVEYVALVTPG